MEYEALNKEGVWVKVGKDELSPEKWEELTLANKIRTINKVAPTQEPIKPEPLHDDRIKNMGIGGRQRGKGGVLNTLGDVGDIVTESMISPFGSIVNDFVPEDGMVGIPKHKLYGTALTADVLTAIAPPVKAAGAAMGALRASQAGPLATKVAGKIGDGIRKIIPNSKAGQMVGSVDNPSFIKAATEKRQAISHLEVEKNLLLKDNENLMKVTGLHPMKPDYTRAEGFRTNYDNAMFMGRGNVEPLKVMEANNKRVAQIDTKIADLTLDIKKMRHNISGDEFIAGASTISDVAKRMGAGGLLGGARMYLNEDETSYPEMSGRKASNE